MNLYGQSSKNMSSKLFMVFLLVVMGCCDEVASGSTAKTPYAQTSSRTNNAFMIKTEHGMLSPSIELESKIKNIHLVLTNSGFRTTIFAISIGNEIESLSNMDERRRLSGMYMDTLENIFLNRGDGGLKSRALDNFAQLLVPWESFVADQECAERAFGLMYTCLRYYNQAINDEKDYVRRGLPDVQGNERRRRTVRKDDATWNFKAGLARFTMAVTNDYLVTAGEKRLLGEKYEYWRRRIFDEIDAHPVD